MQALISVPRLALACAVALLLATGGAAAETSKKKPAFQMDVNAGQGVFGQTKPSSAPLPGPTMPSAPVAAPETPKVESESEPPTPLAAAPRYLVERQGGAGGDEPPGEAQAEAPATGYLPEHPYVSGLLAGLVGTKAGAWFYGGPMRGDQSAVVIGFGARLALFAALGWLVFRLIARRFDGPRDNPFAPRHERREPH
jgi:hypothetical protein